MANQGPLGPKIAPQNDLYTTLLVVAASVLLAGGIYICVRTVQLLESLIPPTGG